LETLVILQVAMVLVERVGRDGRVGFEGRVGWSKEEKEVGGLVVEVVVLDEGEGNLIGYRLGKGFKSWLGQG